MKGLPLEAHASVLYPPSAGEGFLFSPDVALVFPRRRPNHRHLRPIRYDQHHRLPRLQCADQLLEPGSLRRHPMRDHQQRHWGLWRHRGHIHLRAIRGQLPFHLLRLPLRHRQSRQQPSHAGKQPYLRHLQLEFLGPGDHHGGFLRHRL